MCTKNHQVLYNNSPNQVYNTHSVLYVMLPSEEIPEPVELPTIEVPCYECAACGGQIGSVHDCKLTR